MDKHLFYFVPIFLKELVLELRSLRLVTIKASSTKSNTKRDCGGLLNLVTEWVELAANFFFKTWE